MNNKDEHADKIAKIVTYYFMAQRVKPGEASDKAYTKKLVLLHQMLVPSIEGQADDGSGSRAETARAEP